MEESLSLQVILFNIRIFPFPFVLSCPVLSSHSFWWRSDGGMAQQQQQPVLPSTFLHIHASSLFIILLFLSYSPSTILVLWFAPLSFFSSSLSSFILSFFLFPFTLTDHCI